MDRGAEIVHKFIVLSMTMTFVLLPSCEAECPSRNEAVTLDLEKFLGEWYVVSASPPNGKSLSKCGSITVTSTSPDTFVMEHTALSAAGKNWVTFNVNARLDDPDVTGNWQVRGSNRMLGPFKHRVIEVDYDSYFVMIACSEPSKNLPVHKFAMISSRGKTLPPEILSKLKDKAGSYVDRAKILDADHSSC